METRAGVSVVLSLCIVAVAAVALYHPEPARTSKVAIVPASEAGPGPTEPRIVADASEPLPEPTAGVPLPAAEPTAPRPVAVPAPKPAPTRQVARRRRPDSAFTTIGVGETLADVASRVYGTADAADSLFRANRDLLNAPDDPLQVGGMLRTP